jgi:F-box and leucine-rich repeat protein 2/20
MNAKISEKSALFPQQSYFGATPNPEKDPYDRRKVK